MRFKRFTFSWKSPLLGFHAGRNPVSGQRFVHVAPFPFFGIDFNLPPYDLNESARATLARRRSEAVQRAQAMVTSWDEFGQGYAEDGELVVCICGAAFPLKGLHYCPYDEREEDAEEKTQA